jgi:metal-responsive CopG/Arc/MetJ family transcriptional regulator
MESSYAIKASITLPKNLEAQLRRIAKKEHRSLSGLLQEAARSYLNIRRWEELQRDFALRAARLGLRTEDDVNDQIHDLRVKR